MLKAWSMLITSIGLIGQLIMYVLDIYILVYSIHSESPIITSLFF